MLDVPVAAVASIKQLPVTTGISVKVERLTDLLSSQRSLVVELGNPDYEDLFEVFCDDLIVRLQGCTKAVDAIATLLLRLARWTKFLSAAADGLTHSEIVGLFGELTFLRDELVEAVGLGIVSAWTGADRSPQDFIVPDICAFEVKTTASRDIVTVQIHGERQLDVTGLQRLFLVFARVEEGRESGESLNDVVREVRTRAGQSREMLSAFNSRLAEAGYLDRHVERYEQPKFKIAERRVFEVTEGFPTVVGADLPLGVSDISYRLDLGYCAKFECTPASFRDRLSALNMQRHKS